MLLELLLVEIFVSSCVVFAEVGESADRHSLGFCLSISVVYQGNCVLEWKIEDWCNKIRLHVDCSFLNPACFGYSNSLCFCQGVKSHCLRL